MKVALLEKPLELNERAKICDTSKKPVEKYNKKRGKICSLSCIFAL